MTAGLALVVIVILLLAAMTYDAARPRGKK